VKNYHLNFRLLIYIYISLSEKQYYLSIFYQFLFLDRQGNSVYLEIKKKITLLLLKSKLQCSDCYKFNVEINFFNKVSNISPKMFYIRKLFVKKFKCMISKVLKIVDAFLYFFYIFCYNFDNIRFKKKIQSKPNNYKSVSIFKIIKKHI